jgi:heme a synthase
VNLGLHRFAVATAAATVLLLTAGGLVTSTESGLSVPDWPTTYGQNPLTFPLSKWVGGIRFEHSHRLIASAVGLMTVVLALWLARREPRRWVRRLGYAALAAVVAQGILGGLTVLFFLPTAVSVAHACLAQSFFCLVVALAVVTSPAWKGAPRVRAGRLARVAVLAAAAVFLQLTLGAVMRHIKAGLAIPDFPLAFGRVIPPLSSLPVAIHFAHRAGALVVLGFAVVSTVLAWRSGRKGPRRAASILLGLVALQFALGALTVLSGKAAAAATAHVVVGALVLAAAVILALTSRRGSRLQAVGAAPALAGERLFRSQVAWK